MVFVYYVDDVDEMLCGDVFIMFFVCGVSSNCLMMVMRGDRNEWGWWWDCGKEGRKGYIWGCVVVIIVVGGFDVM